MARMTSKLKNRLEVYTKQKVKNELGKWEYIYVPFKKIYSQIIPLRSRVKDGQAGTEYVESTHKIKIRKKSLPKLDNTYRFKYQGQIFEVLYIDPDFQYNEFYEIYTRLVIE